MSRELDQASYLRRRYRGSQAIIDRRERKIVGQFLKRLGPQIGGVLDAPSGVGRFTAQLRRIATERLVCGDLWGETLQALRRAEHHDGTAIETKEVDLYQTLPFASGEFDLVFNFRFFHHIRSAEQRNHVAAELARVTSRYLIVSYYATASIHAWQKHIWRRKGHVRSLPMIPLSEFHQLFVRQGMRVVEDRSVLPLLHAHHIVLFERQMGW
ncbi:MAG: class I SAM-dependent methyltransferase [Arenicellales bacterium]|nr:class I SAM-dependent methyltransferase [Arenicellales bacterium]